MDWTRKLKFRHLRLLVALHESGNLSRTAEAMALTQPAVSKWLQEIEGEIGEALFLRSARGVTPTPMGELLVRRARVLLHELEHTQAELAHFKQGDTGPLRLGSTPVAMADPLPRALSRFHQRWPKTRVNVESGHLDLLLARLGSGQLDLILTTLEDRDLDEGIVATPLYQERMALVARAGHPLARHHAPSWSDALACAWIGPPPDSLQHRELRQELAMVGLPMPRFLASVDSSMLLATLVSQSDALGLVSGRSADFYARLGLLERIALPTQRVLTVGALHRQREGLRHPLIENWLAVLIETARAPLDAPPPRPGTDI
jgi:DNA-binding transcriptional LysR family regulator